MENDSLPYVESLSHHQIRQGGSALTRLRSAATRKIAMVEVLRPSAYEVPARPPFKKTGPPVAGSYLNAGETPLGDRTHSAPPLRRLNGPPSPPPQRKGQWDPLPAAIAAGPMGPPPRRHCGRANGTPPRCHCGRALGPPADHHTGVGSHRPPLDTVENLLSP